MCAASHFDEARHAALSRLCELANSESGLERAVLIDDVFGRIRAVLWLTREAGADLRERLTAALADAAGSFWSAEVWVASDASPSERLVYDRAWQEGVPSQATNRVRTAERYRNRGSWFRSLREPLWRTPVTDTDSGPPIIVFYSFKGGVGRSTALAAFAIQQACLGKRVSVVDFDLDAPGVGSLLAADEEGRTASWGVLDYLLERPLGQVDLRDYYHACRREAVTGPGEILVVPAGQLDTNYLGKLARVDLGPPPDLEGGHPAYMLLDELRKELQPDWILLDARAGLSEPGGLILSGIAHLHLLFGTSSEQSWQGLRFVLRRLGADRVRADRPQAECLLAHAMVPSDAIVAGIARPAFADRARDEFAECYYAEDPQSLDEDRFWYVRDLEDEDAPHVPISISYESRLAHFKRIDDVAQLLAEGPDYRALSERVTARFLEPEQ